MIPPFDDNGYLPPGVHPATLDEIEARFGRDSEIRVAEMESVRWLIDLARRAGVERIILNGSFVTDIIEPNDVDCALLAGKQYRQDTEAAKELSTGLPFLDIHIVRRGRFAYMVGEVFASDRFYVAKGMVEVIQWH
jgi:hypothetical protein